MMPVHFKSTSEYKQKFGPVEVENRCPGPGAGIESDKLAVTMEPPLQQKKRLDGPPTSLSTNNFGLPSQDTEFTLLGQQEKFASNVRYQPKPSALGQKIYKNKENLDDAPPPSKQLKMQKRIKPLMKERHPPRVASSPPRHSPTKAAPLSPPPAPRESKDNMGLKEALKDKDLKDVLQEEVRGEAVRKSGTKQDKRDDIISNMNEFVQTDMKKGVALSAPEAPADYSLKYKAKVAPPRPVKKFSEYQKQFQWKEGIKASPLLAAEEIVYKTNAELGPYKSDAIPKLSEYARQFQHWEPQVYAADVNMNFNNNNKQEREPKFQKKKAVTKRSKSAGAVLRLDESADLKGADKMEESKSEEKMKEHLKKSHGKIKRLGSEYRANFKSPLRYSYEQGAWKGAAPAQFMPQASTLTTKDENNNRNNNNDVDEQPLSNWFAEVLELRRRAEEYRKRAQGTHFSREHLVQLMAKQNNCWDSTSEASTTVQALNLETPAAGCRSMVRAKAKDEPLQPADVQSNDAAEGESPRLSDMDGQENEEREEKVEKRQKGKGSRRSRKMAWLEEQKRNISEQKRKLQAAEQDDGSMEEEDAVAEGRLTTPNLQASGSARRHHLDRTTPAVGGAILTCPPSRNSKLIMTSRSGDSYVTASDTLPEQAQQKTYNLDKLMTIPTLGRPTGDTHYLRDDAIESDQPLITQYISSPPLPADTDSQEDKENQDKIKPSHRKAHQAGKPSKLTTVNEGYSETYNKSQPFLGLEDIRADLSIPKDDDVMSMSLRSVASSSSLASEILDRARKRQQFWNKNGSAVH